MEEANRIVAVRDDDVASIGGCFLLDSIANEDEDEDEDEDEVVEKLVFLDGIAIDYYLLLLL